MKTARKLRNLSVIKIFTSIAIFPARQRRVLLGALTLALSARADDPGFNLGIIPDASRVSLDAIGLYAAGYQYRSQPEQRFPDGWSGGFETRTGVAMQPAGEQNGRAAFLLHPPWRGGTGVAFQEFYFHLPPATELRRIVLTGATAMRQDAVAAPGEKPKSDGATFRIIANGRKLLDEQRADTQWKDFSLDLTAWAGQTLKLRFETDPGPRNDASFDFALWGGRELFLDGFTPKPTAQSAPPPMLDFRRIYPAQNGEVAPPSGFNGKATTAIHSNTATLTYRGEDGTLEYEWKRPESADDPPLGRWKLRAMPAGGKKLAIVPFAGDARVDWVQPAVFKHGGWRKISDGVTCTSTYDANGQSVALKISAKLSGKSLVLESSCDVPLIGSFDAGRWGPVVHRRAVPVPYYSGQVFYLEAEDLFVNAFLDWTQSSASAHENARADYLARTDGTRNPLHQRVVFTAAWHLAETLPNIPNPASPFREHLADKIVLDIWGGRFDDIARNLTTLHDYGINNCIAIIHDWQRSGYDNALPAHVPANEKLGGDAAMKKLVNTAKQLGYDIALHENYVDYYPNYEGFTLSDVSLDPDGDRVKAWFNPGTKIQSFAVQPHAILPLARKQSAQIRERYQPNADYLDVHSAVPPWFHVDFRAGADGAGTCRPVWEAHRQLWNFERATYGGPVLGEGANHWFWSGLLDGVEAQFGAGWPGSAGRAAPLMVDFDLLKIHPLQFNHGMGYYERWWNSPAWGPVPPMEVLDQYRMQEIIFGHAGFLGAATYANVPLAWLEHHLLSPVSARYAAARPVKIQYQLNGEWADGTAAAKTGIWNRVRVTYENGLVVTANDQTNLLHEGSFTLPQFGWLAQGAGVTAWTALRQDVIADFAETPESTFANARPASDWNQSGIHHIHPAVAAFQQTGEREFTLTYEWRINEELPRDHLCFVHFVRDENISFQNDHALPRQTSTWLKGETLRDGPHTVRLPDDLPDGDYEVRIGLYQPDSGRLLLQGRNDGQDRIRTGTLHVRAAGRKLRFDPEPAAKNPDDDIYQHRLNLSGKVLDFGDLRTDGSVLVRREGTEWVLRTLPRTRELFIELNSARFGNPSSVRCVDGAQSEITPDAHHAWWQLKPNGAREYRW